jgi:KDO2-lipid IV(A) lauroyltransferase
MTDSPTKMRQEVLWRIEALAFDLAQFLSRTFPIDAVSNFGAWVARRLGPLTGPNRVALTNLRIAFPHASQAEIDRLLDAQWGEFGRWAAEFPVLDRIVTDPSRIEVIGAERLAQIRDEGRPVVFFSGHFSSMELMSAVILHAGIDCWMTGRDTNNPYVNAAIRKSRRRYGVVKFAPKGARGTRDLLRALGRGESVALMADQKFNGGVAAPFFGVTAHTAPGSATFALRFGIPLQPMSVRRKTDEGARYQVIVHEPIWLEDTGDRDADVEAGVRRINAFIEERVRERPHEWFWVHKRWPNETYKRPAKEG